MKHIGDGEPTGAARERAPLQANEQDEGSHSGTVAISRSLLQRGLRHLSGADAKIYLALCVRSQPDGTAKAPIAELARIAGVGVRTVYGSLRRLEKAGLVRVESRVGGSTANTYRVFTNPGDAP